MRGTSALLLGAAIMAGAAALPGAATPASDARRARHVLNRVTFGPRPGDVARVQRMGVKAFIDEQLHPERFPDRDLARRLEQFETTQLSSPEIAERYELPALQERRDRQQQAGNTPPTPPATQEMLRDPERQRANLPLLELSQQKIVRAVYSERQLEEVLTDFWFNHFNVDARKGPTRYMLTEYEREAIRPHVLGHFRDLLGATAKSPAMLFYLDNWMSADPGGPHVDPREGLNENYGRELLELHTLGVDGGYTQKDVTEVARAFTGWTIDRPRLGGGFRFAPALHDDGEKMVLGQRVNGGGAARRRAGAGHSFNPSVDRTLRLDQARHTVRQRPPAGRPRAAHDLHVPEHQRRPSRSHDGAAHIQRVPLACQRAAQK